jgi:hypothetical protein
MSAGKHPHSCMVDSSIDRSIVKNRFVANMRRAGEITSFVTSNLEIEKGTFFQVSGVKADLLRLNVVFLHATFEDLVRSFLPISRQRFTFNGQSDLRKAIRQIPLDTKIFESLLPPLAQLAKRRIRIVHFADLPNSAEVKDGRAAKEDLPDWRLADAWQDIHWRLSVSAFFYRLIEATGSTNLVEDRAKQNVESALVQHLELGRSFVAFAKLPVPARGRAIQELHQRMTNILKTLELTVDMFLSPDGLLLEKI